MRLHRFYIEASLKEGGEILITDTDLIHQLKSVFRLGAGDSVLLFNNSGFEFLSDIVLLTKNEAKLLVKEKTAHVFSPKLSVHLFPSIIKKDHLEWVLEKATEIGVGRFTPVVSDRTEKKDFNFERGVKIIKEAAEQSGKNNLPTLDEAMSLEDAIGQFSGERLIALHINGHTFAESLQALLLETQTPIGILIGPEGGWSEKEIELFRSKSIPVISLGSQILRAETASIVASALLLV